MWIFEKLATYFEHLHVTSKHNTETDSLISELLHRSPFLEVWCGEDIMIHYNNDNNAYYWAVNAQNFETIEHNTV